MQYNYEWELSTPYESADNSIKIKRCEHCLQVKQVWIVPFVCITTFGPSDFGGKLQGQRQQWNIFLDQRELQQEAIIDSKVGGNWDVIM